MSRRRIGGASAETAPAVRLHVISTGWPYKPCHSPKEPVVVFHGANCQTPPSFTAVASHACSMYADLARSIAVPDHDNVFVMDVSEVAVPSQWLSELGRPGRATRMLERWWTRFNPVDAKVIVNSEDIPLLIPLLRVGGERRIRQIIVIGPSPGAATLLAFEAIKVALFPGDVSADALRSELRGSVDGEERPKISDLYFVSVEFGLDTRTKQLFQKPTNITAEILHMAANFSASLPEAGPLVPATQVSDSPVDVGSTAPPQLNLAEFSEKRTGYNAVAIENIATHHFTEAMPFSKMVVQVLASMAEDTCVRAVVADVHGSVDAIFPIALKGVVARGQVVEVSGKITTNGGCLRMNCDSAIPRPGGLREGYSAARIGQRNMSQHRRRVGCILMRGGRCVLVRGDTSAKAKRLTLPSTHASTYETEEQAAVRSVAQGCDIYTEEVALLRDVAPAIVYETSGEVTTVYKFFPALATSPPPAGYEEESEDEDDLYDWFGYEQVLQRLSSSAEKEAIVLVTASFRRAIDAGVVVPDFQCTFGAQQAIQGSLNGGASLCAANPSGDIPITILSGFVGSGKTSVLRKVFENTPGLRAAAIINDLSSTNVDAMMLACSQSSKKLEHIFELSNGCACCTLSADLEKCISSLRNSREVDFIIIEACGLSKPLQIAKVASQGPAVQGAYLDALVTVVDLGVFASQLPAFETALASAEGSDHVLLFQIQQIVCASVLVLNKRDLLNDGQVSRIRSIIRQINPTAELHETRHGDVPSLAFWQTRSVKPETLDEFKTRCERFAPGLRELAIQSTRYRKRRPFHPQRLATLLADETPLPDGALEIKGIIWIASRSDFAGLLQCVSDQRSIMQGQPWWAAIPKSKWPAGLQADIEPLWEDPHGDRMQDLFIVSGSGTDGVERLLDACLLTDEEMAQDWPSFEDKLDLWEDVLDIDAEPAELPDCCKATDGETTIPKPCGCTAKRSSRIGMTKAFSGQR